MRSRGQHTIASGTWRLYDHEKRYQAMRDAAPELYEALVNLCDGMDDLDRAANRETYTAARAALAKAEATNA